MRAADGTIAGSALRIDQAVRNYMSYADISFEQAVMAATHAPAKLIGLEGEMGRIAPGHARRSLVLGRGVQHHRHDGRRHRGARACARAQTTLAS